MRILFATMAAALVLLTPAEAQTPAGCQVSTAAPTYVNGTTRPLSCDTAGTLRTSAGGGAGGNVNLTGINGVAPVTGHGTASGALRVELPTDGTGVVGLNAGAATIGGVKLIDTAGTNVGAIDASGRLGVNDNAVTIAGNAINVGVGASGTGTQRVILSTDSALAANQSTNVAQINGVAATMGNGVSGTGVLRVTLASDSTGQAAIAQTTPGATNGVAIAPNTAAALAIVPVVSASGENNHVLKASAGNLYSVYATNLTATAGFLVVLNATTSPADGAITPLACVPLAANGVASINFNPGPVSRYGTGITAVLTSANTCFTKTTGVITGFISGSVS